MGGPTLVSGGEVVCIASVVCWEVVVSLAVVGFGAVGGMLVVNSGVGLKEVGVGSVVVVVFCVVVGVIRLVDSS